MTQKSLTSPFSWTKYSTQLARKIETPRSCGYFSPEAAASREMRLATGSAGSITDGNCIALYWLVDPTDGIIADAKFQVFGNSALIGAAEAACELLIGKNYDQAQRMGANLIDKHLRDRTDVAAFPDETSAHLNLVIDSIDEAASDCEGIPLAENYAAPPAPELQKDGATGGYPGFSELSEEKKLSVIETVIAEDVRPYIEMDAGGIKVLELINGREVIIAYEGACTSCPSSIGATLGYIQQVLHDKVDDNLKVVPNLDSIDFM